MGAPGLPIPSSPECPELGGFSLFTLLEEMNQDSWSFGRGQSSISSPIPQRPNTRLCLPRCMPRLYWDTLAKFPALMTGLREARLPGAMTQLTPLADPSLKPGTTQRAAAAWLISPGKTTRPVIKARFLFERGKGGQEISSAAPKPSRTCSSLAAHPAQVGFFASKKATC